MMVPLTEMDKLGKEKIWGENNTNFRHIKFEVTSKRQTRDTEYDICFGC